MKGFLFSSQAFPVFVNQNQINYFYCHYLKLGCAHFISPSSTFVAGQCKF